MMVLSVPVLLVISPIPSGLVMVPLFISGVLMMSNLFRLQRVSLLITITDRLRGVSKFCNCGRFPAILCFHSNSVTGVERR